MNCLPRSGEDCGQDVVVKVVRVVKIARAIQKKTDKATNEALEVVWRELKRKGRISD